MLKNILNYTNKAIMFFSLVIWGGMVFSAEGTFEEPTLDLAIDPIRRVFTLLITVVGIVFIGVVLFGAIKISTSFGDPKGLEGGKKTLTYAVFGAIIVLGFFVVVSMGIPALTGESLFGSPNELFDAITEPLNRFLIEANIYYGKQ